MPQPQFTPGFPTKIIGKGRALWRGDNRAPNFRVELRFGIVAPVGRKGVQELLNVVTDASDKRLPVVARMCLAALGARLRRLKSTLWSSTV